MIRKVAIPQREALFDAIFANPDDDGVRLVYADYLDGLDPVRVECPKCKGEGEYRGGYDGTAMKCPTCDGEGTVIDASDADLAELIRLQIWQHHNPIGYNDCGESRRVGELLAAHPSWSSGLRMPCQRSGCQQGCTGQGLHGPILCEVCGGSGDLLKFIDAVNHATPCSRNPTLRRGLTLRVGCRLEEVVREVQCLSCSGRGFTQGRYADWKHPNDDCVKCNRSGRVWQPTPWATVFWKQCVGRGRVPWWGVTDREATDNREEGFEHCWYRGPGPIYGVEMDHVLPPPIWELIPYPPCPGFKGWKSCPTPDAAIHALELALYQWVYSQVNKEESDGSST